MQSRNLILVLSMNQLAPIVEEVPLRRKTRRHVVVTVDQSAFNAQNWYRFAVWMHAHGDHVVLHFVPSSAQRANADTTVLFLLLLQGGLKVPCTQASKGCKGERGTQDVDNAPLKALPQHQPQLPPSIGFATPVPAEISFRG